MKKIGFGLGMFLMMIMLPVNAYALSGSLSVTCSPSEVKPGGTTSCLVKATTDGNVTSVEIPFSVGIGATIEKFTPSTGWQGDDINGSKIDSYTSDDFSGTFNIGTLTVKINDNAEAGTITLQLNNPVLYDGNYKAANFSGTNTAITVTSGTVEPVKKGLSALSATNGVLAPTLSDTNFAYMVTLDSADTTTFSINATPANGSDSIKATNADTGDAINLDNITFATSGGKPEMAIKLEVGSGDTKTTYDIIVARPAPETGSVGELSSLTVGGVNVTLTSGKYDYEVTLDNVNSYEVRASIKDSSKFQFNSFLVPPTTLTGAQEFALIVEPKDSSSGLASVTYKITVKKKGATQPSSSKPTIVNPQTGGPSAIIMASVLIIALFASLYLYKKNINGYNQ